MKKILLLSCLFLLGACGGDAVNADGGSSSSEGRLDVAAFVQALEVSPDAQLIDVRTPDECRAGVLANSTNLNYHGSQFEEQLAQLSKDKPVFVYCQSGGRSAKTYYRLKKLGHSKVYEMKGGYRAWEQLYGEK
ncbi:MAG: rhodanese-like domain-containing protein [Bacteroidota bacterium]